MKTFLFIFFFMLSLKSCSGVDWTMYRLTNQERVKIGLKELKYDPRLVKSATIKACDLRNRNYWSHQDPDGRMSWYLFPRYQYKGENLAKDLNDLKVVNVFMNSPSHKSIILDKDFKYLGIGKCGNFTVFHFGGNK